MRAPPTKPEPPVTKAAGMRAKLALLGGCEVPLGRGHRDRLLLDEVAHRDLAGPDANRRSIAAVVRQPVGATHRCRPEAADGPELAGPVAPEVAHRAVR